MKIIGVVYLLVVPLLVIGQSYTQRFDEAFNNGDTVLQRVILTDWWLDNSYSADLAVSQFRFHKERFAESADNAVRQKAIAQAFSAIDEGIARHPDRLDMRFHKIGLLGELLEFDTYTREIIAVFDQNDKNNNHWLWKENATVDSAPEFLQEYVSNYVVQLYNQGDTSLHGYMDDISNRILTSYPQHLPSLSNLAVTALSRKDYNSAITHLQKAEAIDNTNTAILGNLAYAYEQNGDTIQSIYYYERVIEYGDANTKDYAKRRLQKLKTGN